MMKVAKYRERMKKTAPKDLHFHQLYYCYFLATKSCLTFLRPNGLQPARFLCLWDFPGKNTGVGCHLLLQRIFPPQGLNLCLSRLLNWQFFTTLPTSHLGSPFHQLRMSFTHHAYFLFPNFEIKKKNTDMHNPTSTYQSSLSSCKQKQEAVGKKDQVYSSHVHCPDLYKNFYTNIIIAIYPRRQLKVNRWARGD